MKYLIRLNSKYDDLPGVKRFLFFLSGYIVLCDIVPMTISHFYPKYPWQILSLPFLLILMIWRMSPIFYEMVTGKKIGDKDV